MRPSKYRTVGVNGDASARGAFASSPTAGRERSAFTLVELLVVVAIISLLITILMPSLQRAMAITRRAVCACNLKNLATAAHFYATDNDGFFPHADGLYMYDTSNVRGTSMAASSGHKDAWGRDRWIGGRAAADEHWWHSLGLLHRTGLLGSDRPTDYVLPELLYCPSEKKVYSPWWNVHYTLSYVTDGDGHWVNASGSQTPLSSSYLYHAHSAGDREPRVSVCPRVEEMVGMALVADRFHYGVRNHDEGYNAVLTEGSVQWKPDPDGTEITVYSEDPDGFDRFFESWRKLAE